MRPHEAATGAIAAFTLNWIWENAQAFLFESHGGPLRQVWVCTVANFGDVGITALIFAVVVLAWHDRSWHRRATFGHSRLCGT